MERIKSNGNKRERQGETERGGLHHLQPILFSHTHQGCPPHRPPSRTCILGSVSRLPASSLSSSPRHLPLFIPAAHSQTCPSVLTSSAGGDGGSSPRPGGGGVYVWNVICCFCFSFTSGSFVFFFLVMIRDFQFSRYSSANRGN